ncbi:MAG: thiolase family protein [Myxococcota bacterium]
MVETVIVQALRSPIGRIRGVLAPIRPDDLLAELFGAVLRRSGIAPEAVDEVFAGCANQAGEDNRNIARMAWLIAGLPYETPAITVNRLCASGLDAIIQGCRAITVGDAEIVVVGGVESMSRAPLVVGKSPQAYGGGNREMYDSALGWRFPNPRLAERFDLEAMGVTAENLVDHYKITREAQDAFALRSHRRAVTAFEDGLFDAEIVPVKVLHGRDMLEVTQDEGPRSDTSLAALQRLKPIFRNGGTVTAGNASSLNDGAAALILMSAQRARAEGITPLATIAACANAGVEPRVMGTGPIPASRRALSRAQLRTDEIDLVEINEAFAVQVLAVTQELGIDPERVNVHGGAIALGHPLGCSGARIMTTLLHAMARRGSRTGLATLCVGVGQGTSVVVRRDG